MKGKVIGIINPNLPYDLRRQGKMKIPIPLSEEEYGKVFENQIPSAEDHKFEEVNIYPRIRKEKLPNV